MYYLRRFAPRISSRENINIRTFARLGDNADVFLIQPALELLEDMYGPEDR